MSEESFKTLYTRYGLTVVAQNHVVVSNSVSGCVRRVDVQLIRTRSVDDFLALLDGVNAPDTAANYSQQDSS